MFDRPDTNIGSATFETVHSADLSRDLTEGTVYLRGLDISPEHRGEGYDSETYRDFERHMIRLRVREIILVPRDSRMREFWRREGFKTKETLPNGQELWSKTLRL